MCVILVIHSFNLLKYYSWRKILLHFLMVLFSLIVKEVLKVSFVSVFFFFCVGLLALIPRGFFVVKFYLHQVVITVVQ